MLIFITGGARSGKSTFAEQLAENTKKPKLHYIATSIEADEEMSERIERHQTRRNESRANWITWEIEQNIGHLHKQIEQNSVILLDCLTTLVNNELFQVNEREEYQPLSANERKTLFASIMNALHQLQENRTLIIVSNEIFDDALPFKDETTMAYVELLGKLHQQIVNRADEAYLCENGIPIQMK